MDSFDHIENMENTLRDNFTESKWYTDYEVLILFVKTIQALFLDSYAAPNWGKDSPKNGVFYNG
jgi:hypothetical protein